MALQQCLNQLALVAVDMRLHGPWLEGILTHCGDVYGLMLWEGPNFYPVGGRVGLVTMVGNALGSWIGRREQWHDWRELAEDLIGELVVSGLLPGHDENVNLQICNTLRQVVNGLLTITADRRNKDRLAERLVNMVFDYYPAADDSFLSQNVARRVSDASHCRRYVNLTVGIWRCTAATVSPSRQCNRTPIHRRYIGKGRNRFFLPLNTPKNL